MSVLKLIWGLVKKIWVLIDRGVSFLLSIFSSLAAWVIAGVIYLAHLIFDYVGDFYEGIFEKLFSLDLSGINVPPLATWLAKDLLALDVAWECFAIFITAWFATRLARMSFSVVRLIIDIL